MLNDVFVDEALRATRRPPRVVRLPALQPAQLRRSPAGAAARRAVRARIQRVGNLDEPSLGAAAEIRSARRAHRAAQRARAPISSSSSAVRCATSWSRAAVDADRILVNPNGVDPDRYTPAIDGGPRSRARYGFDGKTVVGFISTFQPWHGAEVLARGVRHADARSSRVPRLGAPVDDRQRPGAGRDEADPRGRRARRRVVISRAWSSRRRDPQYLAACDILASPHVPNADGSPFFGSPTKLFEYMAMGKAIVASDLDQIGEVLRHGETAWMVPPADAEALARGLARLVDDPDAADDARRGGAPRRARAPHLARPRAADARRARGARRAITRHDGGCSRSAGTCRRCPDRAPCR